MPVMLFLVIPLIGLSRSSLKSCAKNLCEFSDQVLFMESLILAQNERWRRGLGMQVERESSLRGVSKVAKG